jgi:large subunit ribosomal protein L24
MHIKKGDSVKVIAGKDKGKTGSVLKAFPKLDKVVVEGVNMHVRHEKRRSGRKTGQIVEKPFPVHVSNVMKADRVKSSKKK